MKEGILTGHHVVVTSRFDRFGTSTIRYECDRCELKGNVTAKFERAEATVADLMATHWAATGGERS